MSWNMSCVGRQGGQLNVRRANATYYAPLGRLFDVSVGDSWESTRLKETHQPTSEAEEVI